MTTTAICGIGFMITQRIYRRRFQNKKNNASEKEKRMPPQYVDKFDKAREP
jgi:hypothetical protein